MPSTAAESPAAADAVLPYFLALSAALSRHGRHREAAAVLRQARPEAGDAALEVDLLLVEELISVGDPEPILDVALELLPGVPDAAARALGHLRKRRPASVPNLGSRLAEQDWNEVAARSEVPATVRDTLLTDAGAMLLAVGRPEEALVVLQTADAHLGQSDRRLLQVGQAQVALHQPEAALATFAAAAASVSAQHDRAFAAQVQLAGAAVHESAGRVAEALTILSTEGDDVDQAARPQWRALRASCLVQAGRSDEARALLESESDGLERGDLVVVTLASWAWLGLGELSHAEGLSSAGLRRYPESHQLAFVRVQAKAGLGTDLAGATRRISRVVATMPKVELEIAVNRTVRLRPADDPAVRFFLAAVRQAAGRPETALAELDRAVELLASSPNHGGSELSAEVRRMRADLLQDKDPARASLDYLVAGTAAFDRADWAEAVDLLTAAERLASLPQEACWALAEAWVMSSYTAIDRTGAAQQYVLRAIETWQRGLDLGLPELESGWTYITRGRAEHESTRSAAGARAGALTALLFSESNLVVNVISPALVDLFSRACRTLGWYGLSGDMLREGVEAGIQDAPMVEDLLVAAANAGDLTLYQRYLPQFVAVSEPADARWAAARLHVLEQDAGAALAELGAVPAGEQTEDHSWLRILAHAIDADQAAVDQALDDVRDQLTESVGETAGSDSFHPGRRVLLWLMLGEHEAAAGQLERNDDTDSWFTDIRLDQALVRLVRGETEDVAAELERFVTTSRSYEDVMNLGTVLEVLTSRRSGSVPHPMAEVTARVRAQAHERLAGDEWPADADTDLAELARLSAADGPGSSAATLERAITARRAWDAGSWITAIDAYRELLRSSTFPEAEQALVGLTADILAAQATQSLDDRPAVALVDIGARLSAAADDISPGRQRRDPPQSLELAVGDVAFHCGDHRACSWYERAARSSVSARGTAVVAARLHIAEVIFADEASDGHLEAVLAFGDDAATILSGASTALLRTPLAWQRVADAWSAALERLRIGPQPSTANALQLALADALVEMARLAFDDDKVDETEVLLRRVFELRSDLLRDDDPSLSATRQDLATVLSRQGRMAEAEAELRTVVRALSRTSGETARATLDARFDLAVTLSAMDKDGEAETEMRAVVAGRTELFGPLDPETLYARERLGAMLRAVGRFDNAEIEQRAVVSGWAKARGEADPTTLRARDEVFDTLYRAGRNSEAETEIRATLAVRLRSLGAEAEETLATRQDLAGFLRNEDRTAEATTELDQVAAAMASIWGEDAPTTLLTREEVALLLRDQGQFEAAETALRDILARWTKTRGEDDPDTLAVRRQLWLTLYQAGNTTAAETEARAVVAGWTRLRGEADAATLAVRTDLALLLRSEARWAEAEAEYRDVLTGQTATLGEHDEATLSTRAALASTLYGMENFAAAAQEFRTLIEGRTHLYGVDHPETLATRSDLAYTLYKAGDYDGAEAEYRILLHRQTIALGAEDRTTLTTSLELGRFLMSLGRADEGESEIRRAVDELSRTSGPDDLATLAARESLALALNHLDRNEEAERELRIVVAGRASQLGEDHELTAAARQNLADLVASLDRTGNLLPGAADGAAPADQGF